MSNVTITRSNGSVRVQCSHGCSAQVSMGDDVPASVPAMLAFALGVVLGALACFLVD
jgi:hypothetical protein